MDGSGSVLQYVTAPIPLVGLVLLVLAGLVPALAGDRKTRRTLTLGLLGIGALVAAGGIWLEARRLVSASQGAPAAPGEARQPAASAPNPKPTATQTAAAADDATAVSAGGNVTVNADSTAPAGSPAAEGAKPPAEAKQKATASGRGVAISAGGNVQLQQR
jgi:hypothetical protein